ncbi:S8 family serine peptidase [Streptomyces smyrnaeus]|uniref:S8 family serine peptidase n=1 Tax=Streptomyces smyrnaeus TaxID=1387713 RepID=UPI0033C469A3
MTGRRGRRTLAAAAVTAALGQLSLPAPPALAADRVDTSCRRPPQQGEPLPDALPGRNLTDRLGLAQAWDLAEGEGITVGVVDSGVDDRHPELSGAVREGAEVVTVRTKKGYRIQRPKPPALDCEGHGTAVVGLIAARRGGEARITGVAPASRVEPVRVVGGVENAPAEVLAAAIDRVVDSGVQVLNLSFALPVDRAPVRKAVERAVAQDVVVVAAAGNEGTSGKKMYPAAYDGVLAVGAVQAAGQPMKESNSGGWVDLAGYGQDEVVLAAGGSGYRRDKGTSFAAPQVSGAAALVRSRFPRLSARQVRERLVDAAAPVGGGTNERTGAGVVDPFGALTHLAGDGGRAGAQQDRQAAARPGAIPVQAVPRPRPLLSPTGATALAWSGGLLLTVLLAVLGAPAVRRAAARRWRPARVGGGPRGAAADRAGADRFRTDRARPPVAPALDGLTGGVSRTRRGRTDPTHRTHRTS